MIVSGWRSCSAHLLMNSKHRKKSAMTYKGYTASMAFDVEDKIIVGRVEGIDDIIAFHGESIAEFEANFHAVVDDCLAACAALGGEPERPVNVNGKLMLRIAPEVHAAAIKAAARSGVSLSKWAEKALGEAAR
jgi:predicted HicB family RNase H-like nuclease